MSLVLNIDQKVFDNQDKSGTVDRQTQTRGLLRLIQSRAPAERSIAKVMRFLSLQQIAVFVAIVFVFVVTIAAVDKHSTSCLTLFWKLPRGRALYQKYLLELIHHHDNHEY